MYPPMTVVAARSLAAIALLAAIPMLQPRAAAAQVWGDEETHAVSFGASLDLATGFVWRGLEFSDQPNIQPGIWFGYGPFEVGTWASRSLDGSFHEQDLWITYSMPETPQGQLSISLNDYYIDDVEAGVRFPDDFLNYDGTGPCEPDEEGYGFPRRCARGMHYLDLTIAYEAPVFPLGFLLAYNIHNDPEHSFYGETSLTPSFAGFDLAFTAGGVFGTSEYYYEAGGAGFTNLRAGAARTLELGNVGFPIQLDLVHNPRLGNSFYVARAGVAIEW